VEDGVLWRHYARPNHNQDWLQLLVPKELRPYVLEFHHQGIDSGHLGQDKTLGHLKERFYCPGHFGVIPALALCLVARHVYG